MVKFIRNRTLLSFCLLCLHLLPYPPAWVGLSCSIVIWIEILQSSKGVVFPIGMRQMQVAYEFFSSVFLKKLQEIFQRPCGIVLSADEVKIVRLTLADSHAQQIHLTFQHTGSSPVHVILPRHEPHLTIGAQPLFLLCRYWLLFVYMYVHITVMVKISHKPAQLINILWARIKMACLINYFRYFVPLILLLSFIPSSNHKCGIFRPVASGSQSPAWPSP